MALDFPSSPATGQTYTGPDGTVWKWDGAKWVSGQQAIASLIGQMVRAQLGAGSVPQDIGWVGLGWTVLTNDTGVSTSGSTWTPPAGRWMIGFNVQFSGGQGAVGIGFGINGAISNIQGVIYSNFGPGAQVCLSITDVLDFNGTTPITPMAITNQGPASVTAQSFWWATRVR